ncbi:MAG TPA: hypothetical protein VMV19_08090 [Xanthobacteraceae bacterium]|nr:hypothetical protein [Xanthobacteraceae bacterium]
MRALMLAAAAALVLSVQMASIAKAEDTTIIKKDTPYGDSKTVIKKHEGPMYDRVGPPRADKKVIIHHDD